MERKLILSTIVLFIVCLPRSFASGADDTSLHSNKTQPRCASAKEELTVFRNKLVEVGSTVTLNCLCSNITWDNMIYVIWKINLPHKNECHITVSKTDKNYDTCQDGKMLNDTQNGAYQLIIPNVSVQDEGYYTCDVSYISGGVVETIKVSVFAQPKLFGWLKYENGNTVAVCQATSKPNVSIHWETPWNISSPDSRAFENEEHLYTVISSVNISQNASHKELTCTVYSTGSNHTKIQFSNFAFRDAPAQVEWPIILVGVCATCSLVALLTGVYIMRKKLLALCVFRNISCKPEMPASNEEKSQQPCDPEEVQPYASYVQRINSIYNSSAELFNV